MAKSYEFPFAIGDTIRFRVGRDSIEGECGGVALSSKGYEVELIGIDASHHVEKLWLPERMCELVARRDADFLAGTN